MCNTHLIRYTLCIESIFESILSPFICYCGNISEIQNYLLKYPTSLKTKKLNMLYSNLASLIKSIRLFISLRKLK